MEQISDGCGYQGYEFGARYPDSYCVGGSLWDADDCDSTDEGMMMYEPMQHIPCPMCHPIEYILWRTDWGGSISVKEDLWSFWCGVRLTFDIWKNRVFKTEPWKS